jgi:hypothetical protein
MTDAEVHYVTEQCRGAVEVLAMTDVDVYFRTEQHHGDVEIL